MILVMVFWCNTSFALENYYKLEKCGGGKAAVTVDLKKKHWFSEHKGRKLYMEGSEVPGPGPTHLSVSTFGRVYEIWGRCRALISNWGGPWHRYKLIGQLGSKSGAPSATQTPPHRGQIPDLAKP